APAERPCLEAQIMDWADDVAYSVHDIEDGVLAGRIDLNILHDTGERDAIIALAARHFSKQSLPSVSMLRQAAQELLHLPLFTELVRPRHELFHGLQVVLKQLTSELVGRFVTAAVAATRSVHGAGPLCRYPARLVVPEQIRAEVVLLKSLALH